MTTEDNIVVISIVLHNYFENAMAFQTKPFLYEAKSIFETKLFQSLQEYHVFTYDNKTDKKQTSNVHLEILYWKL